MASLLSNTRRTKLGGLAVLLTLTMLYIVYQTPLSINTPRPAPLDLTPDRNGQVDGPSEEDEEPDTLNFPINVGVGNHGQSVDDSEEDIADLADSSPAGGPKPKPKVECDSFQTLQSQKPGPPSEGHRKFPYVRPPPECRNFKLPAMEAMIERMKGVIADPDLFRLFENSYPNTLDTMVKWRGYAKSTNTSSLGERDVTDEELTYVITGDIDAMWLRDSASQIYSYLPFLEPSNDPDSLASLWRGLINSHSRYIVISPYCHSFQPPEESGIRPTVNGAFHNNNPQPPYDPKKVFDCKWELDSLASFLQISAAYYTRTKDLDFFAKYQWVEAVKAAVDASAAMRLGTYDKDGKVLPSAWTFTGYTNRGSETLTNDGLGNPVKENGMVRSGFRPSDDACIFQLLTPSNMMFAAYLEQASVIMEGLGKQHVEGAANLTTAMRDLAKGIRKGISRDAVVHHRDFGEIFAYEVDGYGSANLMDDANVPSLLAMPLWNYTHTLGKSKPKMMKSTEEEEEHHDYAKIYQNTRKFVLSMANPYYSQGPALSAVGGPHLGPGKGWPMAAIVAALTAYNDELSGFKDAAAREEAVALQLGQVLNSTGGTGVIHESVNAWNANDWTRSWFGWANGIFGELIMKIAEDEEARGVKKGEGLLGRSWQDL
ncbi:hypothetical protein QBC37DRAFT_307666 [Rhypophila decipiens]|uniref:Glycoside hydrolase family 125 protein n=1 Tax=Rhypophila decipiens TaxID=261697 RepID=A0AAN7BBB1_9PEZI|nr:hypothetical protein QBC37DRAFT_307666 [Rhypophila decipiens]